jgi:hypothetical protein
MSALPSERAAAEDPAIERVRLKVTPGTEIVAVR